MLDHARGKTLFLSGLAFSLAFATPAQAQDDDGMCRNGMFAEQNAEFGLARVIGRDRSRFYSDMDGCPQAGASCQGKAWLVPGDRVVTGRTSGAFVCVFYPNATGGTAGWMPRQRLAPIPVDSAPPLDRWLGRWSDGDNWVRFSRQGSGLAVKGLAFWPAANPPASTRPGGPNTGEIDGSARPEGSRAAEPGCGIGFRLLGDYLVVIDPERTCDGMNVTFSGIYRRSGKTGSN